jgi:chromosome segregation protein
VLEPDGTVRAGPLTAAMGLLSRRSELDAIGSQIAEVDARIHHLAGELTDGNAQARALEEELNALRNAIYQLNTEKVEITSQSSQLADQLAALAREQPVLDRELAGLLDQIGRLKDDEARLTQSRQQLESSQAEHSRQIDETSAQQREVADNLKSWGEQLTTCRVALGQVQEKQLAAQQHVQRQTALQAELKQQLDRIAQSIESATLRRGEVEAELASAKHHEATLVRTQDELSAQLSIATEECSQLQQAATALARDVDRIRESHAALEQSLHELQLQFGELRVRTETLVTRTREELQLDLPARYAGGYEPAEMDWDAVAEEIRELRDKIQRLGNVNLDAIGEQTELEQRQEYLARQFQDLTESKKQLEELIDTINRESGIRFEQTFNAVREHFQGMFRKLFGGGKADIYLETELEAVAPSQPQLDADGQPVAVEAKRIDPLEAGIEIIARPPGKQPVTISQLSGGEKTMTCVALLMSIFKSKPSPFCILDEVDAALDEANNQRFNLIVQEFLDQSQFIIITHSKRTMQIADVLYGVTMQEQGVSKRVAVKFDQIDAHGRISESAAA